MLSVGLKLALAMMSSYAESGQIDRNGNVVSPLQVMIKTFSNNFSHEIQNPFLSNRQWLVP